MSKGAILILLIIAFGFCFAPKADGAVVTISIEAVVDTVEDEGNYLEGQILPGNIITGYYTYESTTPDTNPLTDYAVYYQNPPLACVSFTVNGLLFRSNPDALDYRIAISNGYELIDSYSLRSKNNFPLSDGTLVQDIYWLLVDDTANAIETDALLTTAPVLSDWPSNNLRIEGDRTFLIDAHVTSAVPEPGTIVIFCLGGLFLRKGKFLW